jgi:hypothetical protein
MQRWRILKEIVPPVLWRAIGGLWRASGRAPRSADGAQRTLPLGVPSWGPKGLNYVTGAPVIVVPLDRIRYADGRRYAVEEHHFLQYYEAGLPALRRFYERHQPANVFEAHFLPTPAGTSPPETDVPWLTRFEARELRGDGGLGPEHGDQAYGPVSERKLRLEAARLDAVLTSIREHGFRSDRGGHPSGYFMIRCSGGWVFALREGFHRVAAMAHLGYGSIEVVFTPGVPRVVEEADVADWPLVRAGVVDANDALALFSQYFRGDGRVEVAHVPPRCEPARRSRYHRGSSTA